MSDVQEFRPEITSRRSEWTAWALALGLGVALFVGDRAFGSFATFVWIFEAFLLLSALSISLGNWVDRKSVIRLDAQGVAFENGLRSVRLGWPEVRNVAVMETRSGRRVQVVGPESHFTFKMLTESNLFGQSFSTGFADGQFVLDAVLKNCRLQLKGESEGMYYYARA